MASQTPPDRTQQWKAFGITVWSLVGLLLLVAAALWLLGRVFSALVPFMLALVIVFLLKGVVDRLEKERVPRTLAVLLCYIAGIAVLAAAGVFIAPYVVEQVRQFIVAFPTYYESAVGLWASLQGRYAGMEIPAWAAAAAEQVQATLVAQAARISSTIAEGFLNAGSQLVNFLLYAVLAMVIGFYLLRDLPKIKEEVVLLSGRGRQNDTRLVLSKISFVLGGFLRGQAIIALIVGVLTWIGMAIAGIPYALVIGIITGMFNIVPYLGPVVGGFIAAIAGAFVSPLHVLWAIVVVFAVNQIEGALLSPRIMSDQVDLHPVLVVFSLLVGGTLFGFAGLLLAIPVAAVAKALFVHYFEKHSDSELCSQDGALFRTKADGADCENSETN